MSVRIRFMSVSYPVNPLRVRQCPVTSVPSVEKFWLKSMTRTVISVSRPLIFRYISVKRTFFPLHHRYLCSHSVVSALHAPISRAVSGRGDRFYHRITKFYMFCPFSLRYITVSRFDRAFMHVVIFLYFVRY